MAGSAITSANVAQAIVKLVAAQGLPAVMGAMVMGNLVNRDYEPTLANAGDTVNIPIPPVLTTYNVAEGGSVTLQNPSLGNAQIVLTQHAESTFTIPDVTAALVGAERGDFGILNKYLTPAMIAIAERIEIDLLGLYTNLVANPDVGAGATTITENTIDLAEKALFDAKVPESEKKYLVLLRRLTRMLARRCASPRTAPSVPAKRLSPARSAPSSRSMCIARSSWPSLARRPTTWPLRATRSVWSSAGCPSPCPVPAPSPSTASLGISECVS